MRQTKLKRNTLDHPWWKNCLKFETKFRILNKKDKVHFLRLQIIMLYEIFKTFLSSRLPWSWAKIKVEAVIKIWSVKNLISYRKIWRILFVTYVSHVTDLQILTDDNCSWAICLDKFFSHFDTNYSFWDQLRNFLHKFTWIVLSANKLNKLGKFCWIYGQLLNIMSSNGWYEKSLQRSHNYQPVTWSFFSNH